MELPTAGGTVLTGHYFKYLRDCRSGDTGVAHSGGGALLTLLNEQVGERFARLSGLEVFVVSLSSALLDSPEDPGPYPFHPACAEFAHSDYCRESWQLHLTELKNRPRAHWHTCDFGIRCAVVPFVCHGRCPAVLKLACSKSEMSEESFAEHVDLMGILQRGFADRHAEDLPRLFAIGGPTETEETTPSVRLDSPIGARPGHAKVLTALAYIEDRLGDPKLTVAGIAGQLDIHPDYLANLFAKQVGERMSQYISSRRVERAKTLLATTDWPIKRIAHESGFAYPNWFHQVFSDHTGMTPGDFRRNGHGR